MNDLDFELVVSKDGLGKVIRFKNDGYERWASYCERKLFEQINELRAERDRLLKVVQEFDVDDYVQAYEVRGDDGDYMPDDDEQFLIKDALAGALSDILELMNPRKITPSPKIGEEGE